jgi:hypothetical protein
VPGAGVVLGGTWRDLDTPETVLVHGVWYGGYAVLARPHVGGSEAPESTVHHSISRGGTGPLFYIHLSRPRDEAARAAPLPLVKAAPRVSRWLIIFRRMVEVVDANGVVKLADIQSDPTARNALALSNNTALYTEICKDKGYAVMIAPCTFQITAAGRAYLAHDA